MARFTDYREFKTAVGGRLLTLKIGNVAEQANGQCWVQYGDSVVNVTACSSKEPRADIDFLPLSCDYEEKMYAAGKIPGGFIKREGRPSEKATLCARLISGCRNARIGYSPLHSFQASGNARPPWNLPLWPDRNTY